MFTASGCCILARPASVNRNALSIWLNEVIVLYETEGLVFSNARVQIEEVRSQWRLVGSAEGEYYDSERHGLKTLVKAVTFHKLSLEQRPPGWHARVILDL